MKIQKHCFDTKETNFQKEREKKKKKDIRSLKLIDKFVL